MARGAGKQAGQIIHVGIEADIDIAVSPCKHTCTTVEVFSEYHDNGSIIAIYRRKVGRLEKQFTVAKLHPGFNGREYLPVKKMNTSR